MKIKKFEATTEQEAIEKVKNELGLDALVINIKKIQPRGLFAFLRKPVVEVTAAYEETRKKEEEAEPVAVASAPQEAPPDNPDVKKFETAMKDMKIASQGEKIKMLQDMLVSTSDMLKRAEKQLSVSAHKATGAERKYQNNLVQIFYETLLSQGVLQDIAGEILDELDLLDFDGEEEKLDINFMVKIVYNSIINIIGLPEAVEIADKQKGNPRMIAFIGPTGVGKTTTIAKLSADFILKKNLDVGLITADTYRIAAVEQLKTYGDILGVEVNVVYNADDLIEYTDIMRGMNDVIMIDTAGRSHKNKENLLELSELLGVLAECEIFLVLSLTTKYEDMLDIVQTFSEIADFKIIFTKLDETLNLGSVLNICSRTGKKLSYITYGQNVPDDIKTVQPEEVAKALLGLGENNGPSE